MTPEDWIRIGKDIEVLAAECINSSCNIHIALKTYMVEKMINVTVNNSLFFFLVLFQKNYQSYDGFVILHGTDTMSYTASALSYMCENLGKPVVVTGSQVKEMLPRV